MNSKIPENRESATVAVVTATNLNNVVQFQTAYSIDEFSELVMSNIEWLYGGPDGGKYTMDAYLRLAQPGVPFALPVLSTSYCKFIMVKGLTPTEAQSALLLFVSELTLERLTDMELTSLFLPKHWSRLQTNTSYEEASRVEQQSVC